MRVYVGVLLAICCLFSCKESNSSTDRVLDASYPVTGLCVSSFPSTSPGQPETSPFSFAGYNVTAKLEGAFAWGFNPYKDSDGATLPGGIFSAIWAGGKEIRAGDGIAVDFGTLLTRYDFAAGIENDGSQSSNIVGFNTRAFILNDSAAVVLFDRCLNTSLTNFDWTGGQVTYELTDQFEDPAGDFGAANTPLAANFGVMVFDESHKTQLANLIAEKSGQNVAGKTLRELATIAMQNKVLCDNTVFNLDNCNNFGN
jgi:hypothetical protein